MPSVALMNWQNDRLPRLNEVEAHCAAVATLMPLRPAFLDELLRGLVLHLSAHFQGFCRDLYTECSQKCIATIPTGLQNTAQFQFFAHLAIETGNPSYANIKRDFSRFAIAFNLSAANPQQIADLNHLNEWRNKAAHQGTRPLPGGAPAALTAAIVQGWKASCDRLAGALDGIMQRELLHILGVAPW